MGIFAELARLRPMMPFEQLKRAIGRDWRPPAGGWVLINGLSFSARVDVEDKIGQVSFGDDFPATLSIESLHVGMTLDELMVSPLGFAMAAGRRYPFKLTDYVCMNDDGDQIRARVDEHGLVRRIEMTHLGRTYSEGPQFTKEASVVVSAWDYNDSAEMMSDWVGSATFRHNQEHLVGFSQWLTTEATSDGWHRAACEWNWDDGIEPLLWIIRQKGCEKATALNVFYLARPGQLVDYGGDRTKVPGYLLDTFDLSGEIRRRFLDRLYTKSSIAFDGPRAFRDDSYAPENADADALKRDIPKSMRVKIAGRALSEVGDPIPWEAWGHEIGDPIPWEAWEHGSRRRSKLVPPPLSAAEIQEMERVKPTAAKRNLLR